MADVNNTEKLIAPDESILWQGKPQMRSYLLKNIFQPLLPVSIAWAVTAIALITPSIRNAGTSPDALILCVILPTMPIWIYLVYVIWSVFRYQGIRYLITDKAVYLADARACRRVLLSDLCDIGWNIGLVDQGCGTGEVILSANEMTDGIAGHAFGKGPRQGFGRNFKEFTLGNIEDYRKVFIMLRNSLDERSISVFVPAFKAAEKIGLRTY